MALVDKWKELASGGLRGRNCVDEVGGELLQSLLEEVRTQNGGES